MPPAPPETLPAAWYRDPEVFSRERETVFATQWTLIGRLEQLARPGDTMGDTIAGRPVFAIRGKNGELRAYHNVCRHRAGPLVDDGPGRCSVLRCRYHGWMYDIDGTLRRAPGLELGRDIDPSRFGLFPVRVGTWNGLVFACLDDDAPDLDAWLGEITSIAEDFPAVPDMTYQGEILEGGRANWKNYGDNSCEGYHVGFVHKSLGKSVGGEEIEIRPYENGRFVGFDVTYQPSEADPTRIGKGFWIYKFPGLLLHFAEYGFNCERVEPDGPGAVRLRRWYWADEAKAAEMGVSVADAMESGRTVMREDLDICERVQRNLEAGVYDTGRMSATEEPGTIYFQKLVRAALAPD